MARTCRKSATGCGRTRLTARRREKPATDSWTPSGIKTMPDAILILNAGSSSIKLGVFAVAPREPTLLCSGLLDEQDSGHRLIIHDASGRQLFDAQGPAADDGRGLYPEILHWIETYL